MYRGINESLSKYLRVMRCVPVDDVLCVCVCVVKSVHREVERRCRGINESLSKYLRVMRCVPVDDVLASRQRIEHIRLKADNVVVMSSSRSDSINHSLSHSHQQWITLNYSKVDGGTLHFFPPFLFP